MNPANKDDVVKFLGMINTVVYGINPFKNSDPEKEELEVAGDIQAEPEAENKESYE